MKKIVSLVFLSTILMISSFTFSQVVLEGELPVFSIYINGVKLNNEALVYPIIEERGILYVPFSDELNQAIGINLKSNSLLGMYYESTGQYGEISYDIEFSGLHAAYYLDSVKEKIYLNDVYIDNTLELVPIRKHHGIIYMPLTKRFQQIMGLELIIDENENIIIDAKKSKKDIMDGLENLSLVDETQQKSIVLNFKTESLKEGLEVLKNSNKNQLYSIEVLLDQAAETVVNNGYEIMLLDNRTYERNTRGVFGSFYDIYSVTDKQGVDIYVYTPEKSIKKGTESKVRFHKKPIAFWDGNRYVAITQSGYVGESFGKPEFSNLENENLYTFMYMTEDEMKAIKSPNVNMTISYETEIGEDVYYNGINTIDFLGDEYYCETPNQQLYFHSIDGEKWERVVIDPKNIASGARMLNCFGKNDKVTIALGESGKKHYSYDGINWVDESFEGVTGYDSGFVEQSSFDYKDVVWTGNEFVAITNSYGKFDAEGHICVGAVMASKDGRTWKLLDRYADQHFEGLIQNDWGVVILSNNLLYKDIIPEKKYGCSFALKNTSILVYDNGFGEDRTVEELKIVDGSYYQGISDYDGNLIINGENLIEIRKVDQ